jgi:3-oxoacyl-[acyl-carrier protein] reductase
MTSRFNEQVTIVTGGADGLGLALAKRLISEGARVVIFDAAEAKVKSVPSLLGQSADAYKVDVTNPGEVQAAVAEVIKTRGRIDALINCAGITGKTGIKSHEVALEDFERVMAVNVRGSLVTFQAVLPHMVQRGYGRVLHIASISGKEGNAGMMAYSVSKAAVIGMAKVQGKEYAGTGVTVNALAPAVIRTAMVEAMPAEQVKYMTDKIPMQRCGTMDEFATMAAFIVSPENSFTTGFVFDLSGGRATY